MLLGTILFSSLSPGFSHCLLLHGFFKVAEEDGHSPVLTYMVPAELPSPAGEKDMLLSPNVCVSGKDAG